MYELYEAAFSGVNLAYTILLMLVLVYWVIVILGVIDLDVFDFDVNVGGADGDLGGDGGLTGASGGFSWLAFFNVGEAPIMFYVSLVVLVMWIVSVQVNHFIDTMGVPWMNEYQVPIAVAMVIPNLVFALFVAKFAVLPFKRFRNREPQFTRLVGKVGVVTSEEANEQFGRVELPKDEGSLILNVRTRPGEVLHKGDPIEIVERVRERHGEYYLVTKKVWQS